jgi:hypothetical protein
LDIGELWEPKVTKQLTFGTKKNICGLLNKVGVLSNLFMAKDG